MPEQIPRQTVEAYRTELARMKAEASQVLSEYLARIRAASSEQERALAVEMAVQSVDGLVQVYGDAASLVASQLYDAILFEGAQHAALSSAVEYEATQKAVEYAAANHLRDKDEDWDAFEAYLQGYLSAKIMQRAHQTMVENALKDGKGGDKSRYRLMRVPTGAETCAFCLMLASRGAVYIISKDALEAKVHAHCDCVLVPAPYGSTSVKGYSSKQYEDMYRASVVNTESGTVDLKGTLATMRKEYGVK